MSSVSPRHVTALARAIQRPDGRHASRDLPRRYRLGTITATNTGGTPKTVTLDATYEARYGDHITSPTVNDVVLWEMVGTTAVVVLRLA